MTTNKQVMNHRKKVIIVLLLLVIFLIISFIFFPGEFSLKRSWSHLSAPIQLAFSLVIVGILIFSFFIDGKNRNTKI